MITRLAFPTKHLINTLAININDFSTL